MKRSLPFLFALLGPGPALAHETAGHGGLPFEPWMAISLALASGIYLAGFVRLRARSGPGRSVLVHHAWRFGLGMAVLGAAVLSPLHHAGQRSFTAHMLEHELLMLAAAPLLVWARPLGVMLWGFPGPGRRALGAAGRSGAIAGVWRTLVHPLTATALQAAALWIWHLPALFDLALSGEGWHAAQHVSFFGSSLLFWSAMLGPRRDPWVSALCLFATSMISGALGAFMALSTSPWYAGYAALGLAPLGLTPAEDQQLAGILMWIPGGLVHAVAAMLLLAPRLRTASS